MDKNTSLSIAAHLKSIQQLIQTAKFHDAITQSKLQLTQTSDQQHQIQLWYLLAIAQRYSKDLTSALISIDTLLQLNQQHSRANQEQ